VPTVSLFYGIAIRMYLEDHNPPHFHAVYGEHEAQVSIATGEPMEGYLPRIAARLVKEWTIARQAALMDNWSRARTGQRLERIPGLDVD
jgi:hypothetical protein